MRARQAEALAGGHQGRRSAGHRKSGDTPSLTPVSDDQQAFPVQPPRARNHYGRDGQLVKGSPESFAAARSLDQSTINRIQRVVRNSLQFVQPATHEEIIAGVRKHFPHVRATDSSIRTRVRELQRLGRVEVIDAAGVTSSGRAARRFRLVNRRAD